ncbi:MAG: bifunctional enoyl-CoA hydratase/phosphate acetyltransferase [Alphaproteobacteria bacterium]
MTEHKMQNITFDELEVGQTASLKRTLTKKDIELFALVSGDVNPAHLDQEYADESLFRGVIGHGMWSGGLISTVLGTVMPGPGTIYMGQEMKFLAPVRIGDEITVILTVHSKHESKPVVVFDCVCQNSKGEIVVQGSAKVLAPTKKIHVDKPQLPSVEIYDRDHYKKVLAQCKSLDKLKTAVVFPVRASALRAVIEVADQDLILPVLVGPKQKIKAVAKEANIKIPAKWEIVSAPNSYEASAKAVAMAAKGEVHAIMRGTVNTKELIKAVIAPKSNLLTDRRVSHAHILNIPTYHKPLIITDTMINIAPTIRHKVDICLNAVELWQTLFAEKEEDKAKVALLAAIESVDVDMPATTDAACLAKMGDRGQIPGGIFDGPLAFENIIMAMSDDEGVSSPVSGDADILVVPNIESGNALAKQLSLLGHADSAGIVLGAKVPIILADTRKDALRTRLLSCALAVLVANDQKLKSV